MMDTDDESSMSKPPPRSKDNETGFRRVEVTTAKRNEPPKRDLQVEEPPRRRKFWESDDEDFKPPARYNNIRGNKTAVNSKVELSTSDRQGAQGKSGDATEVDDTSAAQADRMARYRKMLDDDDEIAVPAKRTARSSFGVGSAARARSTPWRKTDEPPADEYESPHAVEIGFRKKAVTVTRSEVAAGAEYE